ncbi:MAG: hypothetical protein RO257_00455 [Candidatus Kapabacteria bacterium]|nr:hypothetical protein [Candidatus Kapabacteria bacterium]
MKTIVNQKNIADFCGEKLISCISGFGYAIVVIVMFYCMTVSMQAQKKKITPADTGNVVEDIKDYSKKDNIFSKFLKSILVVEDEKKPVANVLDPDRKIIKKYTGKIIRNIEVEILDVFGAKVDNPMDSIRGWLDDVGNSLHINTKEWLIKDMLIFKKGEKFKPFYIQESERIIRQFSYIYDVRIIPRKISDNPDSIDIMVYVQDIWSIDGGGSLNLGNSSGNLFFKDINFLGFGNEFRGGFKFGKQYINDWDWDGSYDINNIGNTFISSKIYYLSEENLQHYGLTLSRDFISPVIDWGGGIGQHWQNTRYTDTLFPNITARYNQQDYWLGYAFNIKHYDSSSNNQNRFNIAGRVTRTVYTQKPEFDSLNIFQDNTFLLARIGFSDRTYYQDEYIFGLGRTEDVPLIKMFEVLVGYESGEFTDRPYIGIKSGYSFLTENLGYLYGGFRIGSFLSNNEWLNSTSVLELMYFTKLNISGLWKWRHFVSTRLSYNYDPKRPADMLNIDNEGGLRGFSDYNLRGNKKFVVNYEADFFVPIRFLGFKLAIIFFADMGLISTNNSSLFLSKLYQGYGLGIRVKNEHLIFSSMQFMIGYYPNTNGEQFNIFYQSQLYYRFNQHQFSIPSVVTAE